MAKRYGMLKVQHSKTTLKFWLLIAWLITLPLTWQQLTLAAPSMAMTTTTKVVHFAANRGSSNNSGVRLDFILSKAPQHHEAFVLATPPRLVVDIKHAWMATSIDRKQFANTPVKDVRAFYHAEDNTLRIVFDLYRAVPSRVTVALDKKSKKAHLIIDVGKVSPLVIAATAAAVNSANHSTISKPVSSPPTFAATTTTAAKAASMTAVTTYTASHLSNSNNRIASGSALVSHAAPVAPLNSSPFTAISRATKAAIQLSQTSFPSPNGAAVNAVNAVGAAAAASVRNADVTAMIKTLTTANRSKTLPLKNELAEKKAPENWLRKTVNSIKQYFAVTYISIKNNINKAKANHRARIEAAHREKQFDLKYAMTLAEPNNKRKTRDIVIVIDPGHGGKDSGARGKNGTREKDVVLAIAKNLQRYLNQQNNFSAILTRDDDHYVGLHERLRIAHLNKADMFLSLHADAYKSRAIKGTTIFALSQSGATSDAAKWLAERENISELGKANLAARDLLRSVLINLAQSASIKASVAIGWLLQQHLLRITHFHTRRIEQANFVVLQSPDIPSLLIETGFISDQEDEAKLKDANYQEQFAATLAEGIVNYFTQHPPLGTNTRASNV